VFIHSTKTHPRDIESGQKLVSSQYREKDRRWCKEKLHAVKGKLKRYVKSKCKVKLQHREGRTESSREYLQVMWNKGRV
jgi:hypothetical protein